MCFIGRFHNSYIFANKLLGI